LQTNKQTNKGQNSKLRPSRYGEGNQLWVCRCIVSSGRGKRVSSGDVDHHPVTPWRACVAIWAFLIISSNVKVVNRYSAMSARCQ